MLVVDSDGNHVTNPRVMGTFNYGGNKVDHAVLDVIPYYLYGNSPDDPTNIFQRVWRTTEAFKRE